jgi:N-dimethylarginine dimethylaminohydrolase
MHLQASPIDDDSAARPGRAREPRRCRYLMCRPTYFTVDYAINPWMDPTVPVDRDLAVAQWERLRACYLDLGHVVETIEPLPELPDMVYAANGATVIGDRVLTARFRHPQRAAEGPAYAQWFRDHGFTSVQEAEAVNEGEGDYLVTGRWVLAGNGFRTDPGSHAEAARLFDRPVVGLDLVDPRFYHLDTALTVLGGEEIAYYPAAFAPASRALLHDLFPDALLATAADADVLGLNATSDGRHVVLPAAATRLAARIRERGYETIGIDLSELLKGGGSVKCCTLELHPKVPAGRSATVSPGVPLEQRLRQQVSVL